MIADEIRNAYKGQTPCFDPADPNSVVLAQVELMAEIAAQLAELNHRLVLFSVGNDDSYKSLSVTVFEPEDETA